MTQALSPQTLRVLAAGATGTVGALLFGALIWIGADAAGVSYAIDGGDNVTLRAVLSSLLVVGLFCTALALALVRYHWGNRWFAGLCLVGFFVSIVSPIVVAQGTKTLLTLIIHHIVGGVLIAVPLLRALGPQQRSGNRS